MGRWDEREKAFDGDTPEEIMDDFEVAKWEVSSYRYKKEQFKIGLDLISEGKRIDSELDFWESRLEKLCRENYKLLKSKRELLKRLNVLGLKLNLMLMWIKILNRH